MTMIESSKQIFQTILKDRRFAGLLASGLFIAIVIAIIIASRIEPSGVQTIGTIQRVLVVFISYKGDWHYFILFPVYVISMALLNSAIAIKLFIMKKQPLAYFYGFASIGASIIAAIIAMQLIWHSNL